MQTLEGVKEQKEEIDTSGHDVQKSEPEKKEQQTSDNTLEDGDEIIDLTNQIIERWGDRCLQSKK
jgi:hypothetical protein